MQNELRNVEQTPVVPIPKEMNRNELLLALYASAIRNVKQAREEIDSGDKTAEQLFSLGKAYWIIEHFIDSLDFDLAPELCADLQSLYHSMMEKMTDAYNTMTSEPLVPVISALEELHMTWQEAIAISSGTQQIREA
ncbi:MAG: flagellar protein FliS [Deltaproteobacteria bacterium]|nr:flagellar protein FliS [Deltaproteobacteria bacterium]MBN2671684.1 flagellar protein FliS [Deltaproteobacteria bacterium]